MKPLTDLINELREIGEALYSTNALQGRQLRALLPAIKAAIDERVKLERAAALRMAADKFRHGHSEMCLCDICNRAASVKDLIPQADASALDKLIWDAVAKAKIVGWL